MANLFFRTNIAPYRVDTYNAIHKFLDCKMYFMSRTDSSQDFQIEKIEARCNFEPIILDKTKILGFTYFKNIWKILKANRPKIVIVPEFKMITLQVLAYKWLVDKNIKVISMCDDSYDMVVKGQDFTLKHTLARRMITPWLDDLLLADRKACEWYRQNFHKGRWMPIIRDEKVEIPLYRMAESLSSKLKSKYGLDGKKILLYVGRLADVKNISTLLKAVNLSHSEFTTVIVGDGPMRESLIKEAQDINKDIIFAGHFEDDAIRAWFNIGDVFVLPSTIEPFGAVTNEALLGGCFVLLSKVCGSQCLIDDSNGRLFDPHDFRQLSREIDGAFARIAETEDKTECRMNLTFDDAVIKVIKELND